MDRELLLHIPHASVFIPAAYRGDFTVPLDEEVRNMTDWFTDALFDLPAARLVFPISRLVCDAERFRDDASEEMARRGMGACYTHGCRGTRIRRLTDARREEILRTWYDPHHRALESLTAAALRRHGRCLIVDCHSFSARPLPYEADQRADRPDICIGTDPFHTPDALAALLADAFARRGYSVAFNAPYAGSIVPLRSYRADRRVLSVMIEVNRGLYLGGDCRPALSFARVRRDIAGALGALEGRLPDLTAQNFAPGGQVPLAIPEKLC